MSPYQRHTPPEAEAALQELTLALAEYLRRTAETARELLIAIRACLDSGATWGEVGKRLGMSKQAARAHWGPYLDQMIAEDARSQRAAGAGPEPPGTEPG
jgi:predicted ArsR family transcriptional regulator